MSWEAVTWANKQRLKKSYEQIVLLVLANCADPNGEAFVKWPGRDHWWVYLSDRTRLPKSSLFRHINTLVGLGLGERTMLVLADGSRRPTFKLNMSAAFDIDLPEDAERYDVLFAKSSAENQSPVGTEHDDHGEHDENDSDISHSQEPGATLAAQSPPETGENVSQSPVGTNPFPVLRPQEDSKAFPKDSPLPPSGGLAGPTFEDFRKVWLRPIDRMSVAERAWDHTPTEKRGEAIAAARGYFAFVAMQRKEYPVVSAQTFLRETTGWPQWLPWAGNGEAPTPGAFLAFPAASAEARGLAVLYDIAGASEAFRKINLGTDGLVRYRKPMTPQIAALAQAPSPDAWPSLSRQQAAAWEGLLRDAVTISVRQHLREGSHAPWPWPPRKDGSISEDHQGAA